jgi:hypothetical protein
MACRLRRDILAAVGIADTACDADDLRPVIASEDLPAVNAFREIRGQLSWPSLPLPQPCYRFGNRRYDLGCEHQSRRRGPEAETFVETAPGVIEVVHNDLDMRGLTLARPFHRRCQ